VCTVGALLREGTALLIKNFDYPPFPTGWSHFRTFERGYSHFALVNHGQRGVNSGINEAGLALAISRSKPTDPSSPEALELRTVLNAEVLSGYAKVPDARCHIESYARGHPEMLGGSVMLAGGDHLWVGEYLGGKIRSRMLEEGFIARANHFLFGLDDNATEDSVARHTRMQQFLKELFDDLPNLGLDEVVSRCKTVLRSRPILNENTRSSLVMDVSNRRVEYVVADGPWESFVFPRQTPSGESPPHPSGR